MKFFLKQYVVLASLAFVISNCSTQNPLSAVDTGNKAENKITASALPFTPGGGIVVEKCGYGTKSGSLILVAKGSDNSVWSRTQDAANGGWTSAWTKIGNAGQAPGNLTIARNSSGRLYLFAKDSNNKIRYKTQSYLGGWYSTWNTLASGFTAMPAYYEIAASTWANGEIVVFAAKSGTGHVNQIRFSNGSYTDIGGTQLTPRLIVGKNLNGKLEVFTTTAGESKFLHTQQTAANESVG